MALLCLIVHANTFTVESSNKITTLCLDFDLTISTPLLPPLLYLCMAFVVLIILANVVVLT